MVRRCPIVRKIEIVRASVGSASISIHLRSESERQASISKRMGFDERLRPKEDGGKQRFWWTLTGKLKFLVFFFHLLMFLFSDRKIHDRNFRASAVQFGIKSMAL